MTEPKIQHLVTGGDDPFLPKLLDAINSATKINITVAFIREGYVTVKCGILEEI